MYFTYISASSEVLQKGRIFLKVGGQGGCLVSLLDAFKNVITLITKTFHNFYDESHYFFNIVCRFIGRF